MLPSSDLKIGTCTVRSQKKVISLMLSQLFNWEGEALCLFVVWGIPVMTLVLSYYLHSESGADARYKQKFLGR